MDNHLLDMGSEALRKAALNEEAKDFILSNKPVFNLLKKAADRYVGGETLEETLPKVRQQNLGGFKCSIEFMGESTYAEHEANEATAEFVNICKQIKHQQLNSTVSLDLSHIGLAISKELAFHNLQTICDAARERDIEVIVSAEGTDRTDAIIETYKKASPLYNNLSITMQAYLYRSKDDIKELMQEQGRIRIVKGAFQAEEGLSMQRSEKLDEAYLEYIDLLLSNGHKCSIATHHDKIQHEAKKLIKIHNPDKRLYEFESLYGICTDQLEALKEEGHPAKLYFVYGKEWYLYVCNRIAEYPMNLFRALNDMVN